MAPHEAGFERRFLVAAYSRAQNPFNKNPHETYEPRLTPQEIELSRKTNRAVATMRCVDPFNYVDFLQALVTCSASLSQAKPNRSNSSTNPTEPNASSSFLQTRTRATVSGTAAKWNRSKLSLYARGCSGKPSSWLHRSKRVYAPTN